MASWDLFWEMSEWRLLTACSGCGVAVAQQSG